jgi:NADH dehydrogenase [ubiquinone] 1 alpha subcomplex assembly factor 6
VPPPAFNPYGVPPPIPPPIPSQPNKKAKKIESFLVKKYRPSKHFRCIEAFQRYTKNHRMTDASFTQIDPPNRGATADKKHVYCTRIGGSDLSWGRGVTRDIAIDNACRAAFALVAAHGYTDFDTNEDCLTVEPMTLYQEAPVPLPPPPQGVGIPGVPPPMPPVAPPVPVAPALIPQAKVLSDTVAVASAVGGAVESFSVANDAKPAATAPVSLSLDGKRKEASSPSDFSKKIKGGLTLLYDAEKDGEILTMEMRRAKLNKYADSMKKWKETTVTTTAFATN